MTDTLVETLADYPPMQVLRAIQEMAEEDDYRLTPEGIVTAATNVADVETVAKMANQKEVGPYLSVVKGDGFPNGIYMFADNPRTAIPLATERPEQDDRNLLHEALAEHGVLTVRAMAEEANRYAHDAGFWEVRPDDRPDLYVPQCIALIHSELSEGLEATRVDDVDEHDHLDPFGEELADAVIRIGDLAEEEGIDLAEEIARKQDHNRGRDHRHGKKY